MGKTLKKRRMEWGNLLGSDDAVQAGHSTPEMEGLDPDDAVQAGHSTPDSTKKVMDEYEKNLRKIVLTAPDKLRASYQRLVASSPVRAMQDKTQVFALDPSDFVRTRLTHSLEVSEIAEHIVRAAVVLMTDEQKKEKYEETFKEKGEDIAIGNEFVENAEDIAIVAKTAGLLHDMGNPPFGHMGEQVIKGWMGQRLKQGLRGMEGIDEEHRKAKIKDLINFEGNAQAIRILLRKTAFGDMADITVSKSVIGALAKYTRCAAENKEDESIWNHKPGYYLSEATAFEDLMKDMMKPMNLDELKKTKAGIPRHPIAFILEAADDIAYATADFEDSFSKGLIGKEEIEEYGKRAKEAHITDFEDYWCAMIHFDCLRELLKTNKDEDFAVHWWMRHVREALVYVAAYQFLDKLPDIMKGTFTGELLFCNSDNHPSNGAATAKLLKQYAKTYAHESSEVKHQDELAKRYLTRLLDELADAAEDYVRLGKDNQLLPGELRKALALGPIKEKEDDWHYELYRTVLDYVSILTDHKAQELAEAYESIRAPWELISKN